MLQGKTESGFEFEIDEDIMDDMEVIEIIAEAGDNALAVPKMIEALLGAEQKARIYEHCRGENGRVRASEVEKECAQIFEYLRTQNETKN